MMSDCPSVCVWLCVFLCLCLCDSLCGFASLCVCESGREVTFYGVDDELTKDKKTQSTSSCSEKLPRKKATVDFKKQILISRTKV